MKTFKIVALQIVDQPKPIDIPLTDGLAINQENEKQSWVIEVFTKKEYLEPFIARKNEDSFNIRVVITHPENDPAPFTVKVINLLEFDTHFSVLLQGKISHRRNTYPELLLSDLIKDGYQGEELLEEFRQRIKVRQQN